MAILPWALFGIMVVFGMIFAVVAWMATRRANRAEDQAEAARLALTDTETRARTAEEAIAAAQQRAALAEQRIAHAEDKASKAHEVAKVAERKAEDAATATDRAEDEARRADAALRERKDAAQDRTRKADTRARSLLDWAAQQWNARREPDRQKAQAVQGAFQEQLDAFLSYRRVPVTFRIDSDIDRVAAPLIERYAPADQTVVIEGDLVRITFPVDPSLGFRA